MILIPEVVICETLNNLLKAIREDFRSKLTAGQENRSMLYLLFSGIALGKYDYYNNLKALIVTTEENPRHLEVKLAYDSGTSKYPQVYITLPSEADRNNSLGMGEGNQDELTFTNMPDAANQYRKQFNKRWATTYNLVAVSDNSSEVVILYHLFKSFLTIVQTHLVYSGLENLRIGGGDLNLRDRIPDKVFIKAITMAFEYEQTIPEFDFRDIVTKLQLYWKIEGAVDYNGPIDIPDPDQEE